MFKFITSKPLWVNIIAAVVLTLLILFLFLRLLGWFTNHGEYLTVPNVTGKNTEQAIKELKKAGFDVEIQDSIFTDTASRGVVLKQLPDANATVKINRIVFLTVNRVIPPMIDMPKLEGMSLSYALNVLAKNHLKLGDTTYRADYASGSVLEQIYNGQRIPEKAKVQWGSTISLVIAGGLGDKQMLVPSLVGLTYAEAKAILDENGLTLGATPPWKDAVIRDTASAYIVKQNPDRFDEDKKPRYIQSGQVVDLWLSPAMIILSDSISNKPNDK
jgi:beta-lactam-binding protein with PASTA domain